MNQAPRPKDALPAILAFLALLVGVGLQLALLLRYDFPLNDGGMLYVMVKDLIANGYRLPEFTTYNYSNIPFAYPPLAFYWTAFLHERLGLSLVQLLRWLPWIFCVLAVPAFGLFSRTVLRSERQAALAMLAFALLLPVFNRTLMGGGLTRAPGLFFALLALYWIARLFTEHERKLGLPAAIFSALAVLSHSVYAWFVIYTAAAIFIFSRPGRRDVLNSALVAGGVVGLVSPWIITILSQHGLAPLVAASQTRGALPLVVTISQLLFFYGLTKEYFFDLLAVTALIGLVLTFLERRYFFLVWLALIFTLDRSAPSHLAIIPLAMLVGRAAEALVFDNSYAASQGGRRILLAAFNYLLFTAVVSVYLQLSVPVLSPEARQALEWTASHTASSSRFVVLSENPWPEDPFSEWFPALAERTSVNTVQGSEWFSQSEFYARIRSYDGLRQCLAQSAASCLELWAASSGQRFDYVFFPKAGEGSMEPPLIAALRQSPGYKVFYDGPGAVIFLKH